MSEDGWVVLSESEAIAAARSTLARAGYTYVELAAQAEARRFDHVGAQLAWMAVRHIGDPEDERKP